MTALGLSQRRELSADRREMRTRSWSSSALDLRSSHPAPIKLTADHERSLELGEVIGLHRTPGGDVWAVASVLPEHATWLLRFPRALYYSAELNARERDGGDSWVVGMSITAQPAATGLRPLTFLPGTLSRYGGPRWRLDGVRQEVVEHTARALRERGRDDPIRVTGPKLVPGMHLEQLDERERLLALEELARPVRLGAGRIDAAANRRALDDLPGEDQRPPGKLRIRPSTILAVR
jgi:hypothetical protein